MRGNQFYIDGRLYRIDYGALAPPWPLLVWNDPLEIWEPIGPKPSSLLVMLPNPYNFVSATPTDVGQPPDFVTTAAGDVISVEGM